VIELVLVPAGIGRYVATLDGKSIVRPTRQPFLDAARVLLALGHDPATLIEASHRGSAIVAMRSTIGEAAKWTVEESDRGGLRKKLWQPHPMAVSRRALASRTAAEASACISASDEPVAPVRAA
jgi:hypothetical protein